MNDPDPHRVLIERATGRWVGPPVPIAKEDWPYSMPSPNEVLWRYMDTWKFEELLKSSALYFARCDTFTDPFEGRLSPGNRTAESKSDRAWREAYGWARDALKSASYHDIHRCCVFISCWHRARKENAQMWKEYTERAESVVIATSVHALTRFMPEKIMKSAVKYHDEDFPRTEFSHNSLFFYKPKSYAFECEFRLLRILGENESVLENNPSDRGRIVPIRLKRVVHRIITHPRASSAFKKQIEILLREHLPGKRREDSAL
jgi:hypothetical protein